MAKRPKEQGFSFVGYDRKHYQTTEAYTRAVDELFNRATAEITNMANGLNVDPNKPFAFADYPGTMKRVNEIIAQLTSKVTAVVQTGSRKQWLYASKKCDVFLRSIQATTRLKRGQLERMQERNLQSLDTFQGRKVQGMNLSQRVWKYTNQYKSQIEKCLEVAIGDGVDNRQVAARVKRYLNNPDALFRRVRDKDGNLQLSKAAKAYHPGVGVYRSAAKNAQRLTRSEINMAYRESDYQRWQELDFVVGFEVKRTNSEGQVKTDKNGNRHRVKCDLCDRLAGKYPKTFKFVGWHPQCMCYVVPILSDYEEDRQDFRDELRAALRGEQHVKKTPSNVVTDVPQGFKDWVAERVEKEKQDAQDGNKHVGSTPYFIRDNFKHGSLQSGLKDEITDAVKVLEGIEQAAQAAHVILSGQELADWRNGHVCDMLFTERKDLGNKELADILTPDELDAIVNLSKTGDKTATETLIDEMIEVAKNRRNSPLWGAMNAAMTNAEMYGFYSLRDKLFAAMQANDDVQINAAIKEINDAINDVVAKYNDFKSRATAVISECKKHNVDCSQLEQVLAQTTMTQFASLATRKIAEQMLTDTERLLKQRMSKIFDVIQDIQTTTNIKRVDVKPFADDDKPTDDEIIQRVGGGDRTKGSCASLAFAYAANKGGMSVLDFRDGSSREYFANYSHLWKIADKLGEPYGWFDSGVNVMKQTTDGKLYYLAIARHAAVVRKVGAKKYEYLELQSAFSNGWKPLDSKVFAQRFSARGKSNPWVLMDFEKLLADPGFMEMMAYINTNDADQRKGRGGTIK